MAGQQTDDDLQSRAQAAAAAANGGRWDEAERIWREVLVREPGNPQALYALGVHAMRRRDFGAATSSLEAACRASPRDALAFLTLGAAKRGAGDGEGELAAIDAALAIDPYFLPAVLAKGGWCDRANAIASAALYYRTALKLAPPESQWPRELRPQLERARLLSHRHAAAFDQHLAEAVHAQRAALPPEAAERWREAASIMAGRSAPYVAQGHQLNVPRLPAIPFFDTAQFSWLAELEADTGVVQEELAELLAADRDRFEPYVAYAPGQPVNQWGELNHSPRWRALHLWRNGEPIAENQARCPMTTQIMRKLPLADIPGLCPNVMFSVLAPHTHIPPHEGETNARVVAHLPLIVPPKCAYRVGYEERGWNVGKVLMFDDTIEHEARNDSDEIRVVLIFDVWNPYLSSAEHQLVRTLMAAARAYQAR